MKLTGKLLMITKKLRMRLGVRNDELFVQNNFETIGWS